MFCFGRFDKEQTKRGERASSVDPPPGLAGAGLGSLAQGRAQRVRGSRNGGDDLGARTPRARLGVTAQLGAEGGQTQHQAGPGFSSQP